VTDLRVRGLCIEYRTAGYAVRPIDGLDLDATSGELVMLLGPSGCGKTSLLSSLAGLLKPAAGSIRVGDTDVTSLTGRRVNDYRRHGVGIVFQSFNLVPSLNALENVTSPLRAGGWERRRARSRGLELLELVSLADRAHARPGALSGGQQQRVAIARALAHDPPLIVADEPTAHLDFVQVEGVLRLLRDLATPGRLVVVATHDHRMTPLADRVVELTPRVATTAALDTAVHTVPFAPGDVVFRQGELGAVVYLIEAGEVDIVRELADGGEELLVTLGPGRYFGEIGPLTGHPRSATARVRTAAVVTVMAPGLFRRRAALVRGTPVTPSASGKRVV
jgi:putative ABC transport system ATP-binding protein